MKRGAEVSFALEFLFHFVQAKRKRGAKKIRGFVLKRLHQTQLKFFESTCNNCFLGF
jgi:hypothetical protein